MRLLIMFTVIENTACKLQSCAKFMGVGSEIRTWKKKKKKKNPRGKRKTPNKPPKNSNHPHQYFCDTILLQLLSKISLFPITVKSISVKIKCKSIWESSSGSSVETDLNCLLSSILTLTEGRQGLDQENSTCTALVTAVNCRKI